MCLGLSWYREVFGASLPGARDTSGHVVAPRLLTTAGWACSVRVCTHPWRALQGFFRPVRAEPLIHAGSTSLAGSLVPEEGMQMATGRWGTQVVARALRELTRPSEVLLVLGALDFGRQGPQGPGGGAELLRCPWNGRASPE